MTAPVDAISARDTTRGPDTPRDHGATRDGDTPRDHGAAPDRAAVRDANPARLPVRRLTVLYDAQCPLCRFIREWLERQRQLVPLEFMAAGDAAARRRFPSLDHRATLDEITVVGDAGQVYRGSAAWVVCLWALREQRPLAHRLSTPTGLRLARGAVLAAAKWRESHRTGGGGRGVYRRGDGWVYDRRYGWTYTPSDCDSGTCATR